MRRFNLYCSADQLKIGLKINSFFGEACFQKNANIDVGGLCPVILLNDTGELYLQTMRFGVDKFANASGSNSKQLLCNARSETILNSTAAYPNHRWTELVENRQKCVIVCRGFYFWHNTEILDPIRKKVKLDKQPYYVQPEPMCEGDFFFIAALYKMKKTHRGYSYSVVALTQAAVDEQFSGYVRRTPVLMTRKLVHEWLRRDCQMDAFLVQAQKLKIQTLPFMKIGLWLNESAQYKHEHEILRPREEWDREHDAKLMGLDDADFPFDAIEQEALKQNNANKMGIEYTKTDWDDLQHNHNRNNSNAQQIATDEAHSGDEHELKQDAVLQNVSGSVSETVSHARTILPRKRLRDEADDDTETQSAPPQKKRKISHDENLYLFEDSPPPSPSSNAQIKDKHSVDSKMPCRRSSA